MEYNRTARGIDLEAKKKYDEAERAAALLCDQLKEAKSNGRLTLETAEAVLRDIVLAKYCLTPEDAVSEYFNALGEISIARALGKQVEDVKGLDLEAKCGGTSSVMTKKILLVMFLNRELGIRIDSDDAADAITIAQLARLVYQAMT